MRISKVEIFLIILIAVAVFIWNHMKKIIFVALILAAIVYRAELSDFMSAHSGRSSSNPAPTMVIPVTVTPTVEEGGLTKWFIDHTPKKK